jgi:hypothetical protein
MICHFVGAVVGHIADHAARSSSPHQVNVVEADACSHDTHYASTAQRSKRSEIKKHLVPGDQDRSRSFSDKAHKISRCGWVTDKGK